MRSVNTPAMIRKTITNLITMFVCLCHAVTDKEITQAIDSGVQTVADLMDELKVATQCGGCLSEVTRLVSSQQPQRPLRDGNSYSSVEIYRP